MLFSKSKESASEHTEGEASGKLRMLLILGIALLGVILLLYGGGIVGKTIAKTTNAKCYCEIDAVGYANTGMIMGIPRADATLASNCQLGGKIATTNGEDGKPFFRTLVDVVDGSNGTENADGSEIVLLPEYVMYYDVIYGGTTEWAEGATYDTCTLLTQKP